MVTFGRIEGSNNDNYVKSDSINYVSKPINGRIPNQTFTTNIKGGFETAKDIMLEHQRMVCPNGRFASGMKKFTDANGNKITRWYDQNKKIISESVIDSNMIMTTTYYHTNGKKHSELKISDNYPYFRGSISFDDDGNEIKSSETRKLDTKT